MTKVSIILPFHKVNAFLEQAIVSVLGSDFADYELLLISDGVGDAELGKISELARGPRTRLLKNPGTGLVDALNFGVKMSQSPYIARMDSDDICHKSRLRKQVEFLDQNPRIDLVGTQVRLICEHGATKSGGRSYPRTVMRWPLFKPFTCEVAHPTVMFRRQAFELAGGYRHFYTKSGAEDFDLWNRILRNGKIANLLDVLLDYRIHASQISSSRATEQRLSTEVAALLDIWEIYSTGKESAPFFSTGSEAINWLTSKECREKLSFIGGVRHRSFMSLNQTSQALSGLAASLGVGLRASLKSEPKMSFRTLIWETIRNPLALLLVIGSHVGSLRRQVFSKDSKVCGECNLQI
jgi:glycosyltransferase involved in cell wall biosynthesis